MAFDRPTNDVTELAKERNRQAIERTLLSWINSALLLLGLGISVGAVTADLQPLSPLGAIVFGIALLVPIVGVYRRELLTLGQRNYLAHPPQRLNLFIVVAVVVAFGLLALVDVVLGIPWL
jgi:uncharacterized membrane protein YidH (DUF202 family)